MITNKNKQFSLTELVEMAYSEGYEAAQKEFTGLTKMVNKASKKAWQYKTGMDAMKAEGKVMKSGLDPIREGRRATNKGLGHYHFPKDAVQLEVNTNYPGKYLGEFDRWHQATFDDLAASSKLREAKSSMKKAVNEIRRIKPLNHEIGHAYKPTNRGLLNKIKSKFNLG